ncbi:MAG: protein kinase domain-containing protein, partial [Gemmatimonadaceae bacterium]
EVLRELGRGGMGIVYLARERATGQERAIKVIHRKFLGDEQTVARFVHEAHVVMQLQHPQIVRIHSVEQLDDAGLALVMDWVPGRTVKQIIRDEGPMPFAQVERILDDIADALGYAHARGIVHRDVKPENIFVDETTGRALLSDFGIARSMHAETSPTLTDFVIGTPAYMAPELIDSDVVDGRSDLYSLGMAGWEMLSGQRPWGGGSLYDIIDRKKHDELQPIDTLRPDAPVRLLAALDGLTEKSPVRRWPTAEDFRMQLGSTPVERRGLMEPVDTMSSDTVMIRRPVRHLPRQAPRPAIARIWPVVAAAALMISATLVFARQQGGFASRPEPIAAPAAYRAAAARQSGMGNNAGQLGGTATGDLSASGAGGLVGARHDTFGVGVVPAEGSRESSNDALAAAAGALSFRLVPPAMMGSVDGLRSDGPISLSIPSSIAPPKHIAVRAESTALPAMSPGAAPSAVADNTAAGAAARTVAARHFSIVPGAAHTCMLSSDGEAYCWGSNNQGQLGTGGTERSAAPVGIPVNVRFSSLAPGLSHTCALTPVGAAYCWGGNDHGQVGDGSSVERTAPVRVAVRRSFVSIATGAQHSCALTADGHVFCWGSDAHGQLGDGGNSDRTSPVAVTGGINFIDVATGWNHACALNDAGAAYCWGSNDAGQLGDGTTIDRSTPTPVQTNIHFVALTGGSSHTCGLTAAGAAYCWGQNRFGQVGDGTTLRRSTPTAVDDNERFASISAGGVHTCGVTRDHVAECWGRNSYGQLGDGSSTDRTRPTRVSGGHSFATVSAFGAHTCGTTSTDELFCWGYNLEGQLGDGTREQRSRPVYVEKPAA